MSKEKAQIIHGPSSGKRIDFDRKEILKSGLPEYTGFEYLGFGMLVFKVGGEWKTTKYEYWHFWRKVQ